MDYVQWMQLSKEEQDKVIKGGQYDQLTASEADKILEARMKKLYDQLLSAIIETDAIQDAMGILSNDVDAEEIMNVLGQTNRFNQIADEREYQRDYITDVMMAIERKYPHFIKRSPYEQFKQDWPELEREMRFQR